MAAPLIGDVPCVLDEMGCEYAWRKVACGSGREVLLFRVLKCPRYLPDHRTP
jgi:hypothetical protein